MAVSVPARAISMSSEDTFAGVTGISLGAPVNVGQDA
jgi:hypothetical protein